MTARTSHRLIWFTTGIYVAVIFTLTHLPPTGGIPTRVWDKLAHFTAFLILGVLLRLGIARPIVAIAVGLAYGAFDEITQPLFDRSADLLDWLADALGLLLGVGATHAITIQRRDRGASLK